MLARLEPTPPQKSFQPATMSLKRLKKPSTIWFQRASITAPATSQKPFHAVATISTAMLNPFTRPSQVAEITAPALVQNSPHPGMSISIVSLKPVTMFAQSCGKFKSVARATPSLAGNVRTSQTGLNASVTPSFCQRHSRSHPSFL